MEVREEKWEKKRESTTRGREEEVIEGKLGQNRNRS